MTLAPPTLRLARPRRLARVVISAIFTLLVLAATFGHLARDRFSIPQLCFYLPLIPIGVLAIIADAVSRGRFIPRVRFGFSILGIVITAWGVSQLLGHALPQAGSPSNSGIRLIQWNVRWGGTRGEAAWATLRRDIVLRRPDLVVLSEAPSNASIDLLLNDLGHEWSDVRWEHQAGSPQSFRLVIASRWPVREVSREPLVHGRALNAVVDMPGRPLRILLADLESDPILPRTPALTEIAEACRVAAERREPIDVVCGDFNAPGRSVGFDALRSQGYRLADANCAGWRGTFPARLPLYDIDHVWLRSELTLRECRLFTNYATDHRGQMVRLSVTSE